MYSNPLPSTAISPSTDEKTGEAGEPRQAQTDNAEITLEHRRLVFENTVFSVYADHISDRQGNEVEQYLSVVPKGSVEDNVTGVAILPTHGDKIGLIRVFRHPLGRWSWEAIRGFVEPGEDTRVAAVRELEEESGLAVRPEHLIDLGAVATETGILQGRTRLYGVELANRDRGEVERELGHGVVAFFDWEEIRGLIDQGKVEDAVTISLFFKRSLL